MIDDYFLHLSLSAFIYESRSSIPITSPKGIQRSGNALCISPDKDVLILGQKNSHFFRPLRPAKQAFEWLSSKYPISRSSTGYPCIPLDKTAGFAIR